MKIVFDARVYFPVISGMSRYIIQLLTHLLAIDSVNQYTILVNATLPEDDEIFGLRKHTNLKFEVVNLSHMGIVNYTKMPAIIKALKPDIYHYPHIDAPVAAGVKTVATIHDANMAGNIKKFDDRFGLKSLYFRKTLKNTLKKSAAVIFISKAARQEIVKNHTDVGNEKFRLVYNGFDHQFGNISPAAVEEVKQKFKLNKPYFLYVGQIRQHKNIQRMIRSFLKTGTDWELILVGQNYLNLDFSVYPSNVRYLSIVSEEELKGLYHHSSAFVFPSFVEGFGFPILESLSYGKPVIGTNYGAIAEIGNQFLIGVDPKDENDIAEKMKAFAEKPNTLDLEVCQNYISQFSWEKCAREVLAIYEELNS